MGSWAGNTRVPQHKLWWKLRIKRNRFHHRGQGAQAWRITNCTLTHLSSIQSQWCSGCNGPHPGNAWWCHLTDPSAKRWFKALPSRQFGPALHIVWQQTIVLQIIEALTQAREVIPQPKSQPNLSKETRRRWQYRIVGPCPVQTFYFSLTSIRLQHTRSSGGKGQTRVSPIGFCSERAGHCIASKK